MVLLIKRKEAAEDLRYQFPLERENEEDAEKVWQRQWRLLSHLRPQEVHVSASFHFGSHVWQRLWNMFGLLNQI